MLNLLQSLRTVRPALDAVRRTGVLAENAAQYLAVGGRGPEHDLARAIVPIGRCQILSAAELLLVAGAAEQDVRRLRRGLRMQ